MQRELRASQQQIWLPGKLWKDVVIEHDGKEHAALVFAHGAPDRHRHDGKDQASNLPAHGSLPYEAKMLPFVPLLQLKKTLIFRVLGRIAEVNAKLWLLSLSMVLIEGHARRQSRPVARQWRLKHRHGNWWWGRLGQCRPRQVDNLNWCWRGRKTSEGVRNTKQHGWLHGVLRWRGVRAILLLRGNNRYCCGDRWPGIRDLWHDGVLSFLSSE